jgi:hypothetical protein
MSKQNYRVLIRENNIYCLHEVFYDDDSKPIHCSEKPILMCSSMKELRNDIDMINEALNLSFLKAKTFET